MNLRGDARKIMAILVVAALAVAAAWGQRSGTPRSGGVPSRLPQPTLGNTDASEPTLPSTDYGDQGTVKFKARAELVLVPVVVKDKNGSPVPGLKADDFTILENGKPQKVSTFEEVRPASGPVKRAASRPNEFTNSLTGNEAPRNLTIIALDTVNTPFLDQGRAREAIIKFLTQNVQGDNLTALITIHPGGIRVIQDFTTDPKVLTLALQRVSGKLHLMDAADVSDPQINERLADAMAAFGLTRVEQNLTDFATSQDTAFAAYRQDTAVAVTLSAFQHVAEAFAGIPGRKSLVWVTGSFPFLIDDANGLAGGGGVNSIYQHTMQMLNHASIAVYPVDVRGLVHAGFPDSSVGSTHAGALTPQAGLNASFRQQSATITTLETFAAMTGGKAFYNRNDLSASFREASEDGSAYYLLGYYLDKKNNKAGWRKLKVKVAREDVHVRARDGFFLNQATEDPFLTREIDVAVALQSPLDYTALPLTVRWTQVEVKGDKRKIHFEIVLPPNAASIEESDNNHFSMDFSAVARNAKGDNAAHFSKTIQARLKPDGVEQIRSSGITYSDVIEVPQGEYNVRFVVRDNVSGKMGSVLAPISSNQISQLR